MEDTSLGENLLIRQAVETDLPYLLSESNAVYMQFLFQSAYQGMLRGEQIMWVAERNAVIIGQVFVQFSSMRPQLANGVDRAYFYSFRVDPTCRGQGIGSKLMNAMEEDLRSRGFTSVTLTVAKTNDRAIRLYERLGYHIVGSETVHHNTQKINNQWKRVKEEAWRMEKGI